MHSTGIPLSLRLYHCRRGNCSSTVRDETTKSDWSSVHNCNLIGQQVYRQCANKQMCTKQGLIVIMGCGFISGGQESSSVLCAAVYKYKLEKRYIESLPLVLKDKRSCFSQGESSTVQLPLGPTFSLRNYDTSMIYENDLQTINSL